MKVSLVRPDMSPEPSGDALEPLGLAVLAGLAPPGVDCALYDERVEPVLCGEPTDLAAMTVETYTARRAYQLAAAYRRRGVPVVLGGYHPTLLPDEALEHAEAVVVGDAEGVWEELLDDARRGRLRRIYRRRELPGLAGQRVDRTIYRGKRYGRVALVQFGRGCPYACDFCSIRAFYQGSLRFRPLPELVAELERLERDLVFFVDDNLFAEPERARRLFRELRPLGIRWTCQCSLDVADDPELVRLMARSGCVLALIGFESLEPANLKQMAKGWHLKHLQYAAAIARLRDAGIMIYGTFVFGYDGDTPDSFQRTLEFALRQRLCLANFNPLTPTPGTLLYDRLRRQGRLLYDRWWLDPEYRYGQATFQPRGMTADELTDGCFAVRRRFNTAGSILRRLLGNRDDLARAAIFLAANLVSRREIYAKQGRRLGAA